ncbi:rhodanese domain-containing protein CG4456 isoform X2 [Anopheles moucheti]|uniref:rhodanese domain-containing protein CG4456 isoform X2 n=1 Tax=Anopheles moucheti TaxID=186751 RepID=UPI0022F0A0DA|nr:rhodanese domain-containing protein CG4456 isoform X2 [Anopheles moucheti]
MQHNEMCFSVRLMLTSDRSPLPLIADSNEFVTGNICACCSITTMSIATYEEVLDLPNHPEKLLIDVRNPDELAETGKIPTSINIPLSQLEEGLNLADEAFKTKFGRDKPSSSTEVIFHCKMGGRAQKATDLASSLGFTNARNYKGSWTEWAAKQGK